MNTQQTNDAAQLYTVGEDEVNKRLDAFLTANNEGWSRTRYSAGTPCRLRW